MNVLPTLPIHDEHGETTDCPDERTERRNRDRDDFQSVQLSRFNGLRPSEGIGNRLNEV